ncbi:MAG TPA: tRNA pseudouridine(38-40) synthase TruA [Gammaproteobacteria bacterium]|nr:tRNA pseudouridine(38-40) synthase TruA [Gammaproteobacteria bacterium]
MRIALGVEYNGQSFFGWQIQEGVRTVQGCLETALSKVANHPVQLFCAGRTDRGVHGMGQVVHFDSNAERSLHSWVMGANVNSPEEVSVLWAKPVDETFHARFSATRRRYRYIIMNRKVRPSFLAGRVSWERRDLDVQKMAEAGQFLIGEHNFNSYRAVACQAKNPVRTIHSLELYRSGPFIILDVEANAFLHHMIRNIAGVLMAIGAGERPVEWAKELLHVCDRTQGGVTAPPHGLYFVNVTYPEQYEIPTTEAMPLVW